MCQNMLIVLPAVAVFLLSINQPDSAKTSKPSLLDHIYTNICDEKRIINSGITIFDISDHLSIFVNFNLHHPTHQNSKPKFRCMKIFLYLTSASN